jgi:hypothetical protein
VDLPAAILPHKKINFAAVSMLSSDLLLNLRHYRARAQLAITGH